MAYILSYRILLIGLLCLTLVSRGDAESGSPRCPGVVIGRATTFIVEPLNKDGCPDYTTWLNRRFSQDITPENNAAIPFWRAIGPSIISAEKRKEFFQVLEMPLPPEKGDYFIDIDKYVDDCTGLNNPGTIIRDEEKRARAKPWRKSECPVLAGWLAANEKPLALVVEASRRPRRFDPLIPGTSRSALDATREENNLLLDDQSQLETQVRYRYLVEALYDRAMLRLGEGQTTEAWQDMLACHRLAGLAYQAPTWSIQDYLFAFQTQYLACGTVKNLLQHTKLTPLQAAKMKDDLIGLPMPRNLADSLDVGARCACLDWLVRCSHKGLKLLQKTFPNEAWLKSCDSINIDWNRALRMVNNSFDLTVAALRKPTRAERMVALKKAGQDISTSCGIHDHSLSARKERQLALFILKYQAIEPCDARSFLANCQDVATQSLTLNIVGLALAQYYGDHRRFPAHLGELVPHYLLEVPKDIFNENAELHYMKHNQACMVYSVGVNGKDDAGRGQDEAKGIPNNHWDDLAIQVGTFRPTSER